MENKKIGILGYGGYIGSYATEKLLKEGCCVLGGQRHKKDLFDTYENFSYKQVDVKQKESLDDFIDQCDVIVNCVSPSHIYGKIVKDAVCAHNKIYIDPSDSSFEENREKVQGKCVASAGYIPGLSEFLPTLAARKGFDEVDRFVMYQGGFDGCSAGSFVDMIIGAGNKEFYGDAYILDSEIKPLQSNIRNRSAVPFNDQKVIFKPLITVDDMKLQKALNAKEFYFFCTYEDMSTLGFFMRLLVDVTKYDKETAAKNIEMKLNERVKANENSEAKMVGAYLLFEIDGKKDNKDRSIQCKIYLRNVNRACGYFLAEVVKAVVEEPEQVKDGFNYGFELLKDDYAEKVLQEIDADEYIRFEEIKTEERISIQELTK